MRPKIEASLTGLLLCLVLPGAVFAEGTAADERRLPISFSEKAGELETVRRYVMPRVDNALLIADADRRMREAVAAPFEFAHTQEVGFALDNSGTWETLDDGSRLWRLRIASPGALHLNLGFERFDLPREAALWIYNSAEDEVQGPYTAEHRSALGRLFTAIVRGDEIIAELHVPATAEGPLDVRLGSVHHGFRGFEKQLSGSCNNDVVCPEGDPWRDQIRSVARVTIDGTRLCTGQLINNTAQNDVPYFLSAFHCRVTTANADTMVIYWNYASPTCGQRGGGSLQNNQTGAIFRASEQLTDFLLVELSQSPAASEDVFFTGWDRSGTASQGSVGIHHPMGDVKSISFNDDLLTTGDWIDSDTHWVVDNWEDGTTEGGSSGSCLWDPTSQLCVGILTAGLASCSVIDLDIYGKLSLAWNSGSTAASRLSDWLDPLGTGVTLLAGKDPGATPPPPPPPPGGCVPSSTVMCLQNGRFQVEVSRVGSDGLGPASVVPAGSDDSGIFYFFSSDNWEMLLKVLDGCSITNHFWVFAAAATDVEYTITVTDLEAGVSKSYFHPPGSPAPAITDTAAFATCP